MIRDFLVIFFMLKIVSQGVLLIFDGIFLLGQFKKNVAKI